MDKITTEARGLLLERRTALSSNEPREVLEIEAALARVADGTYGSCLTCGRAIGRLRLLAIPETRYCMSCGAWPEVTD